MKNSILFGTLLLASAAAADNRIFTYTYEPEVEPRGDWEVEHAVTLGAGRTAAIGQADYQNWQFNHEIEHGFTDRYTASLYVNHSYTTFKDPATGTRTSHYEWTGFSVENRYQILNPADHAVGLTLYLEPSYDGQNAELEQKIILGQRIGDWKWAVNLTHATEWSEHFAENEGELEFSFGLARFLNRHWTLGLEVRDHNELPSYKEWENTAVFAGPVVSYHRSQWWAAMSVMPQIYGANFQGNVDSNTHLELEGHERVNARMIFGVSF